MSEYGDADQETAWRSDISAGLARRRAKEIRFRLAGRSAVVFATLMLAALLASLFVLASSAFVRHELTLETRLSTLQTADGSSPIADFTASVRGDITDALPDIGDSLDAARDLSLMVPRLAIVAEAERQAAVLKTRGRAAPVTIPISDDIDLYLKGRSSAEFVRQANAFVLTPSLAGAATLRVPPSAVGLLDRVRAETEGGVLTSETPSLLFETDQGVWKGTTVSDNNLMIEPLLGRLVGAPDTRVVSGRLRLLWTPESERVFSDRQAAMARWLQKDGLIRQGLNLRFFTGTDSTYPELAGILAALVGSLLTMVVTASLAVPIGIMAAVYLEEFARDGRLTRFIELNINNLAAVPSIIFGLLGVAVLLNLADLPRSAPLVGGLVLALLTLPTIIISARAALRTVPMDHRNAALAIGATRVQVVADHVLPLAMPGILTGSIIGLARALGETAPLLLIGMVAFVVEVPSGIRDEATTLPVLIFNWSKGAERAWEPLTAAAVVVLLALLLAINAFAVYLRNRLEQR
ncbi:MAG: phosphate ABC transporter permease PstA [Pseudomonadota bacterium]